MPRIVRVLAWVEESRGLPVFNRLGGTSLFEAQDAERGVDARQIRIQRERPIPGLPRAVALSGHEMDRAHLEEQPSVGRIFGASPRQRRQRLIEPLQLRERERASGQHLEVGVLPPRERIQQCDRFSRTASLSERGAEHGSRRGVVGDDRDGLAKGANCGFQIPVLPFE